MNTKLMLMGAASALLLSHVCGCAVESEPNEDTSTEGPSAEKTGTEQSDLTSGKPSYNQSAYNQPAYDQRGGYRSPPSCNQSGYDQRDRWRNGYGRGDAPGYDSPGYDSYGPGYNSPGYPPGIGPGYGANCVDDRRGPRGPY